MPINYKKYPLEWKEIRQRILERAENKCECCGLENQNVVRSFSTKGKPVVWKRLWEQYPTEYDSYKAVHIVLTIAHLDHDEENHEVQDDRLKAMCQLCHLRYDAAEKKRRKLLQQNDLKNL